MSLALDALAIARTQVGKKEDPLGSNWGIPVRNYLAAVGLNFPASWCMAFVYWCYVQAKAAGDFPKSGGVLKVWELAPAKNKVLKDPQPGDVFIMNKGKGLGHTGFVEKVDINFIYTIEGNTNDTGSREGIAVCRLQRPRKNPKIIGYLRF